MATFNSPTTDTTSNQGNSVMVIPLTSTTCILTWCSATTLFACVATLSSGTFSLGTVASVAFTASAGGDSGGCSLSSTSFFYAAQAFSPGCQTVVGTVAAGIITFGLVVQVPSTGNGGSSNVSCNTLSSTSVLVGFFLGGSHSFMVATVAGTVITYTGTAVAAGINASSSNQVCVLSSTLAVLGGNGSGGNPSLQTISISGTTITMNTQNTGLSALTGSTGVSVIAVSATEFLASVWDFSTSAIFVADCTVSGTTITIGSNATKATSSFQTSGGILAIGGTQISSTSYLLTWSGTSNASVEAFPVTLASGTPSIGTEISSANGCKNWIPCCTVGSSGAVGWGDNSIVYIASVTFSSNFTKSFTDTYTINETFAKSIGKALSDIFTITESYSGGKIQLKSFTDTFSIVESFMRSVSKSFLDTFSITEVFTKGISHIKSLTDTFTITEVFTKSIGKTFVDTYSIIESFFKKFNGTATFWGNQTKSPDPTWTIKGKSTDPTWTQVGKSSDPNWTNVIKS